MADELLSQDEINALLEATKSGEIDEHLEDGAVGRRHREIRPYDFRGPVRVASDHLRAVQLLHRQFALSLSSPLSSMIRTLAEVECYSVEQLTYGDFLMSVSEPPCLVVLSMSPLRGLAVMEISPQILFPILERLLGGTGVSSNMGNRSITEIEKIIISQFLDTMVGELAAVWSKAVPDIKIKVERIDTDAQYVQVVSSSETVLLVIFEIHFNQVSGMMSLCLPFPMVERALAGIRIEQQSFTQEGRRDEYRPLLEKRVSHMRVPVSVCFPPTQIPIREILLLQEGDVLALDVRVEEQQILDKVEVQIGGKLRFLGKLGRWGKRRAVKLTDVIPPGELD